MENKFYNGKDKYYKIVNKMEEGKYIAEWFLNDNYIDQSEIIFHIKNDEELYERIYRNKNVEIVLGNGLYMTYQLDDKESVEIDSDCYEVEDLKDILKNDNSILNWYKWILEALDE